MLLFRKDGQGHCLLQVRPVVERRVSAARQLVIVVIYRIIRGVWVQGKLNVARVWDEIRTLL